MSDRKKSNQPKYFFPLIKIIHYRQNDQKKDVIVGFKIEHMMVAKFKIGYEIIHNKN